MSKIKIGWAEVDITPKEKISLAGQFFERISDEVESELKAVAMAVESGDEQMIICALDLVSVGQNLHDAVKKRVAEYGTCRDKDNNKRDPYAYLICICERGGYYHQRQKLS